MANKEIERKIAVIFATDVVGYSKSVEVNEEQTIKNFRACKKILEDLFLEHDGRIFNTAGDSVLAEFSSAVSAVICATEFQRLMKERNESETTDLKMEFRIGINMGDVVVEGDNLYGDGVNIAARLEALAQPNGVCLSRSVHEFINKKMDFLFNDLGEQTVKDNKFHAFDVVIDDSHKRTVKTKSKSKVPLIAASVGILLLGIGGYAYYNNALIKPSKEEKKVARDNLPIILVKPFKNLGSEDTSVSNAITESLISSLSRYKGISVLSSSTSFHILENNIPDNEIVANFGVKHAIQGSVQSFGKNTRLTVELNDLSQGKVVWSEKVDFLLDDIFKVQDEIGNKILGQLSITAVGGQQEKQWMSEFETFEQYLLSLNFHKEWGKYNKEGYENTLEILEKFRSLNPNKNIHQRLLLGLSKEKKEDIKKLDYLTNSVVQNRGNETDYGLRALVEFDHLSKDCEIATQNISKALDIGTNAAIFTMAGFIYHACGDHKKAIKNLKEAFRLKPLDGTYLITSILVANWYILGKTEEIKKFLGDKINNKDMWGPLLWIYASMELENGNTKKAKDYFERARERGAKKFMIMQMLRNEEAAEKLTKSLETLGSLD
jgi:class 3 adenylate cyclase/TolB-like protein